MIINNDCLDEMRKMLSNNISAIVTDPPYGLGFMGKDWDAGLPHKDIWAEALRICKPGAHLLALDGLLLDPFAGSGTTILAAQRLGFNAIGIEKSSDYCAIAEERITNDRSMTVEKDNQQMILNF